jgi:2-keto-4-pentenoate hydratase/2-oxohepta-3-ene-1,7-dioic acid hydratase in catechol pathway
VTLHIAGFCGSLRAHSFNLKPGDVVALGIEGLGQQRQDVVAG